MIADSPIETNFRKSASEICETSYKNYTSKILQAIESTPEGWKEERFVKRPGGAGGNSNDEQKGKVGKGESGRVGQEDANEDNTKGC